ncbi:sensor histidine kinase [Thermicanus aegyptius]|uniref:sensor histidine kinase n=1 Tax=Thermicanus aegyptius TaxID=94009 RepID=UPI0004249A58|nr:ATP-binding protein [Thermicanus aegyptius]
MKINRFTKIRQQWATKIRQQWATDLFKRTQIRLTMLYSGFIILFLILFTLIIYTVFSVTISQREEQQIKRLAIQEENIVKGYLAKYGRLNPFIPVNRDIIVIGEDQFFYYFIDPVGRLVFGNEVVHPFRNDLINVIQGWMPQDQQVRSFSIKIPPDLMNGLPPQPENPGDIRLLVAAQPVFFGDMFVGTLYVGKNITKNIDLFRSLFFILVILAVLFSGVAIYLSHLMSKRAMIPVVNAYMKQRQFTADASHELRTPLSVLLTSINALEMEKEMNEEGDFSRKLLTNMKEEVKRMAKLVGDLLTLARSDSEQAEILWENFDYQPIAAKIIESMKPLADSKGIVLTLHAPSPMVVYGDLERLKQLLYLLLDNAIKYTPQAGTVDVTLSIEDQERHPTFHLQVKDTGIGISPEDLEKIFDRFYRVDKARTRQTGGYGLGLSIAKWIVEAHKGTIQADSKVGEGSTFTVKIPQQPRK